MSLQSILFIKIGFISKMVFVLGFRFPEDGNVCVGRRGKKLHD